MDISTSFLIDEFSESSQSKTYVENILQELYTTEKNYVKDLKDIIQGYYNPLFKEIPYNDFNGIFGNIKSVHKFNRKFLKNLSQCKEDVVEVSKLFISHEEDFKVYTAYCTDYPKAQQILRDYSHYPEYNLKLLRCQQHLRHPLPLYTYLFKPVQRVLKYPLLLQNLISHHDSDAVGYDVLLAAHECMLRVAEDINEVKRNQEKVERLIEIQNCIEVRL
ncbi:hypothetical protein HELRODRAFT_63616 [Helobdella robusta]|uniref:DH domain-containing protein n=1 Tax=Helobdella robusta TaxID=6412 RepID=T1FXI4_HELRO|nr:hypothetical protein HELRODRAFT_63616 [Helobdella robusta]ESO12681.1 hypothetical protein HELRODRAFT_63616 [Helobdella robusta]